MLVSRSTLRRSAGAAAALTMMPLAAAEARWVVQVPTGQQTSVEGERMTAAFECVAAGDADVLSVSITDCHVRTSSGVRYDQAFTFRTAAPVAATGWLLARVPTQPFRVCMRTEVIWLDGSLENLPERCS